MRMLTTAIVRIQDSFCSESWRCVNSNLRSSIRFCLCLAAMLGGGGVQADAVNARTNTAQTADNTQTAAGSTGPSAKVTSDATVVPTQSDAGFTSLLDMEGNPAAEGALRIGQGQWTLVMIWATNCHVCKEQKPKLSVFHEKHKDRDARVVGIALDGKRGLTRVAAFMKKLNVKFPTFVGNPPSVMEQYMVLTEQRFRGTPTYLLFDPQGKLMGNNPGPITIAALERFIDRHSVAGR